MADMKRTSEYRKMLPFMAKTSSDVGADTQGVDIQALTQTLNSLLNYKADKTSGIYLMSCFRTGDMALHLLWSDYGLTWQMLGTDPAYTPVSGVVRDPSIVRYHGRYYMAYTNTSFSPCTTFSVAVSDDLATWTHITNVDMSAISGLDHVWAPSWFLDDDGTLYITVSCDTASNTNFQIYEVHPTNVALTTWSTPVLVTGNFPANIIDSYIVKQDFGDGRKYYLWYKRYSPELIEYAVSDNLTSGYTVVQSGDWAGWGTPNEGPSLVQVDANTWRLYVLNYASSPYRIMYSESLDNWATWSALQAVALPWTDGEHPEILQIRDLDMYRDMLNLIGVTPSTHTHESPVTSAGDLIVGINGLSQESVNCATSELGASATAIDTYSTYVPARLMDGNDTTAWISATKMPNSVWCKIDLGQSRSISAFRMHQSSGVDRATQYKVESSSDNSNWTNQYTSASGLAGGDTGLVDLSGTVSARYWRFTCLAGNGGYGWTVNTIELHTFSAAIEPTALPIGSEGQVLTVVNGMPAWDNPETGSLGDHDHSGDAGDGGTFDATNLTSSTATDGQVLTADGIGGAAWENPVAGGASLTVEEVDGTPSIADVIKLIVPNGSLIDEGAGVVTFTPVPAGDVIAPASSTDEHLAVWDGTNSKTLKDGGAVPSGGGVTSVNPTDVANKAVWFDAGTISGNHNDPVTTWADQSGLGLDATQSTAGSKPTLDLTTFILPAVYFSGSKVMSLTRPLVADWTLFAIIASVNMDGASANWYSHKGIFGNEVGGVQNDWALTWDGGTGSGGIGNPDTTIRGNQFLADGAFHVITFTRKKTGGFVSIYNDGFLCASARASVADLNAGAVTYLGAFQSAAGYFTGWIAEIFATSTLLSVNDRAGVEAYYKNKYGIS